MGALLVALGVTVMAGWLLHVPSMVQVKAGLVPMVFNPALCFTLSGLAIVQMRATGPRAQRLRLCIGAALVLLCGLSFLEALFDLDLGVDLARLHTWLDYGNTRPGRMAPNTALGFMLIGATVLLVDRIRRKRHALAVILLTFGVLAIGLTGLAGYLLAPDLLFGWARSARMALHTASGMIVAAIGLWLAWSQGEWFQSRRFFREDEKIRFLGATILFVVTVTVGLTGFVLLQTSLEKTVENNLESIARNRKPWFDATARIAIRFASTSARLAGLDDAAAAALAQSGTAADARFQELANRLAREGFRGIVLEDAAGKPLHTVGRFAAVPEIAAPLDRDGRSLLVWDGEMVLRSVVPLQAGGKDIGRLVFDMATPQLAASLFNAAYLGETGEIAACIQASDDLLCFPGNRHAAPFRVKPRFATGHPLPVEYALAGRSGVVYTLDYRGENVIAAYAPLAPGLGYVVKQDTKQAYAGIRADLGRGAPVILLIAVFGAFLLNSQLHPLAERMRESELALTKLAQYDNLTDLPNRFLFMDLLGTAILRSRRSGHAMALMFLDLDGFKQVNDTLGHAAGDQLLIEFARRLTAVMRRTDTAARLAGDEFTVILEDLAHPEDDVRLVADKILASVREPFDLDGGHARVTVSMGAVIHQASVASVDIEQLLHRADQGMYAAKQAGKNMCKVV